jgi:predicted transcriptional regulator
MKALRIGIMSQEKIRARTIAIAKGEYKPGKSDPKIWFPSMKALSEVLSDHNRELLRVIAEQQPESIKQLAEMTDRQPNNLSRTLATMKRYGLVEIKKVNRRHKPIAKATEFLIKAS